MAGHLSELWRDAQLRRPRILQALIIEDDPGWSSRVSRLLGSLGWRSEVVDCLEDVDDALSRQRFDLLVVDRNLPDGSGVDLIARLRSEGVATPMIMLTDMHRGVQHLVDAGTEEGLTKGADDYVTKPFSEGVLGARIGALAKRYDRDGLIALGPMVVDFDHNVVRLGGERLMLDQRDLNVLGLLALCDPEPVTKELFIRKLWSNFVVRGTGEINNSTSNLVESAISTLRRKLEGAELSTGSEKFPGIPRNFILARLPEASSDRPVGRDPAVRDQSDLTRSWLLNIGALMDMKTARKVQ